jgi:Protein of unknown function (DUF3892)
MAATKWADYAITAVKYHPFRTAITEVEIRNDNGTSLGPSRRVTRQAVVDALGRGESAVTAFLGQDGSFHRGENVRVLNTTHGRFLRTDRDHILADNLNNLPEYA